MTQAWATAVVVETTRAVAVHAAVASTQEAIAA
jgi:hypothetical protein